MPKAKKAEEPKPVASLGGVRLPYLFEQVYNPATGLSSYLNYDTRNGHTAATDRLEADDAGATVYIPWQTDFLTKGVLFLPSEASEYGTDEQLWQAQRQFIHDYCDISPDDEIINTQYVALTWLYDKFNEVSYRRFLGDWGTGKSRALQAMGLCCYRPVAIKAAATPASIFRSIEQTRGTLLIDEANFEKNTEVWAAILGVLNAGYERMGGILRCGKEDYTLEAFQAFGPKVLASRINFPDRALESRCLTCITYQTHRTDLPVNVDDGFFLRGLQLRNQWLMYRFRHYAEPLTPSPEILQLTEVIPRLRQIVAPLAAIRDCNGFFAGYVRRQHEELMEERRTSWEGMAMQAMLEVGEEPPIATDEKNRPLFSISDIAARYRENQGIEDPKDFSPERCGRILRRLGFESKQRREHRRVVRLLTWDQELILRRCRDYGLDGAQVPQLLVQPVQPVQRRLDGQPVADVPDVPVVTERAGTHTDQSQFLAQIAQFVADIAAETEDHQASLEQIHERASLDGYHLSQVATALEELKRRGKVSEVWEGRFTSL